MNTRILAGSALALLLGACAPAEEGNTAAPATGPTAPAADAAPAADHDVGGGQMEGVGPWVVEDDGFAFTLTVMPTPPVAGPLSLTVAVTDPSGAPVIGLDLGYEAYDEDAGRTGFEGAMEAKVPGLYSVTLELGASAWKLTFHGDIGGADRHAIFEAELG